jgi:hypothetical protein
MTADQFGGLVRVLAAAAGGYFVTFVSASDWSTIVVPFVVLAGTAIWSAVTNHPSKLAPKA